MTLEVVTYFCQLPLLHMDNYIIVAPQKIASSVLCMRSTSLYIYLYCENDMFPLFYPLTERLELNVISPTFSQACIEAPFNLERFK